MPLQVIVANNRQDLGARAATAIAESLKVRSQPFSVVFAAAPSQSETLDALAATSGLPWHLATAFHLDEYAGLTEESPQSFRRYLLDRIIGPAGIPRFEGLRGEAPDLNVEILRYSALIEIQYPLIGLIGIGENGHIAFNDPPLARFQEAALVHSVELTRECLEQQVHDGTFPDIDAVPKRALTLTIAAIMRVPELFVMVPGIRKARAVHDTIHGAVSEACPASILRTHPDATLFLDPDSASLL